MKKSSLIFTLALFFAVGVSVHAEEHAPKRESLREAERSMRQEVREQRIATRSGRIENRMERQEERASAAAERREVLEQKREERVEQRQERAVERQERASASAERRSRVATAVQELLSLQVSDPGIGTEVREIAQAQNEAVERIEQQLQAVENRGAILRVLFGADRAGLEQAKALIQQNTQRVNRLERLRSELVTQDPATAEEIQQKIQALQQVNAEFDQTVVRSEGGFSVFGWALRLFGR